MDLFRKYHEYLDAFYTFAPDAPECLQRVYEKVVDGCREQLLLRFSTKSLVFAVNPDDDTIGVQATDESPVFTSAWACVDAEEPWNGLLGSEFGWGWVTVNQQGYCDGVLLSFDGIAPTVLVSACASSLAVHRILKESKAAPAVETPT